MGIPRDKPWLFNWQRPDPSGIVTAAIGLIFLVAMALLCSCATSGTSGKVIVQPDTVYMGYKGWVISFSPNMSKDGIYTDPNGGEHPALAGNGWSFDFPDSDGIHMILVPYNAKKPHKTLTISYRIDTLSGSPKFL